MEKKLEILKLSIPAISELSARKLLGGDGYGLEEETTYTGWELPEVEIGYERPDEWTGDPEEMMMPDDAMDYEDWYQEDYWDINESLNDGFEEERFDNNVNDENQRFTDLLQAEKGIHHLSISELGELIGGKVLYNIENFPNFRNTCAIRMSYILNMSGYDIPYKSQSTISGDINEDGDKEWYYYKVEDLQNYIVATFGEGEIYSVDNMSKLTGRTGIICYEDCNFSDATGHIDLWDDKNVVYKNYDNKCDTIRFWEIK